MIGRISVVIGVITGWKKQIRNQKYLDEWPTKFKNIHIMQNLGGGLGPWNIENYDIIFKE